MADSEDEVAFMVVVVLGVDCVVGEGSMCTSRGLFLGLAVALGSKYMGIDGRVSLWCSSSASLVGSSS